MVSDTLALATREQRSLAPTKFRIGDYEWCEPDYRQILIWAEETGLKPEEVIIRLLDQQGFVNFKEPLFADGKLLKVNLDLRLFPYGRMVWLSGLEITHLRFIGASDTATLSDVGPLPLPRLVNLTYTRLRLPILDLTTVPQLEELQCSETRLEKIRLDCVPKLTILRCESNELAELKLDQTPNLIILVCADNRLTQLNLSGLNRLWIVFCGGNKISKLTLTDLPSLEQLDCENNHLSGLNLAEIPELVHLSCSYNQISKIDVSNCSKMGDLDCDNNRITHLDLSSARELYHLNCANNSISELDLRFCQNLDNVYCYGNPIPVLDIRGLKHLRTLHRSPDTKVIMDPEQELVVQDHLEQSGELQGEKEAVPNQPSSKPKKTREKLSVCIDDYGKEGPECFAEGSVIYINRQHPRYQHEARKPDTYRLNLLRLITWEILRMKDSMNLDGLEAYKWFKLAAEQGNKEAEQKLASLASTLLPGEVQEGERRYRDLKEHWRRLPQRQP